MKLAEQLTEKFEEVLSPTLKWVIDKPYEIYKVDGKIMRRELHNFEI